MHRVTQRLVRAAALISCFAATSHAGLTITLVGDNCLGDGDPFGGEDCLDPRAGDFVGSGNLPDIIRAAADAWQAVFANDTSIDDFELTINFSWVNLQSSIARHILVEQEVIDGINRETVANITFNNFRFVSSIWHLDDTPLQNEEYQPLIESVVDLGAGELIASRHAIADPAALPNSSISLSNTIDLYSVALHEIGHALAVSNQNTAFLDELRTDETDESIEIEAPLPFAGSVIEFDPGTPHLDEDGPFEFALLSTFLSQGERQLISDVDILSVAQVGQYNNPVLLTTPPTTVTPGDFNGDDLINAADYAVFRDSIGAVEDGSVLSGNGDGGTVGPSDFDLWAGAFGAASLVSATAVSATVVPEPASAVLVLSTVGLLIGTRRRAW